jgi:N-acetylglutamate synthase-like GNAT family acetyltransferase
MENISISTDKTKLELETIYNFLKTSYWASERTKAEVKTSIENSMCFGVYENDKQIGLARVVSDLVVFAYVMDFFILDTHQGNGIGQQLMRKILTHPQLINVNSWYLVTKDAQEMYRKFGFENFNSPDKTVMKANKYDLTIQ